MFKKKRVYLDYAAATPLSPVVYSAMEPFLKEDFGNASAIHQEGVKARRAVEMARERVATSLQVRPEYVTFVSGGTEANNLAIIGTIEALRKKGRSYQDMEVVTTDIEHPSILKTATFLKTLGVVIRNVPVDDEGFVKVDELRTLLTKNTVLFSVAYANSEIGTVQKLHAIKKVLLEAERKYSTSIIFHLDAAQAPLWLPCKMESVHADLIALDAGKCCGPKGVGILVRSRRAELTPLLAGGGQESGLRPGTEHTAGIVGASIALFEAQKDYDIRAKRVSAIRDAGIAYLLADIPQVVLNGPVKEGRLANNINISIPGLDTEFATIVLDKHGFAVSTKSACAGAGGGESVVVKVISGDPTRAKATLRISLSPQTTLRNLKDLAKVLKDHKEKMSKY